MTATAAPRLLLDGLSVVFDEPVLRRIDLGISAGEIVVVLGSSGVGKSTLLSAVAGLVSPSAGTVRVDGTDLRGRPPHRRPVTLLTQTAHLFPFTDVAGNVAFSPAARALDRRHRRRVVDESLATVGLAGFGGRDPATLSGGERQRVALARALLTEPAVLLADEPFTALDGPIRRRLQADLVDLARARSMAVLLVTHDVEEALAMADRVVVLAGGVLAADLPPEELWERPPTVSSARLVGIPNLLRGRVDGAEVAGPWGRVAVDGRPGPAVVARPDRLALAPAHRSAPLAGIVRSTTYRGGSTDHLVEMEGGATVTVRSPSAVAAGSSVAITGRWLAVADDQGGLST